MNIEFQRQSLSKPLNSNEFGHSAERITINTINAVYKNLQVRQATLAEDSGVDTGVGKRGLAIDAVGYIDDKPAIAFQITTATDPKILEPKKQDLEDRPFIHLAEYKNKGISIPKVLVQVSARNVDHVMMNPKTELLNQKSLIKEIRNSVVASLDNALTKTKLDTDIELIQKLKALFNENTQIANGKSD